MSQKPEWNEANWKEYQELKKADEARKAKVREQGKKWREAKAAEMAEAKRIVEEYRRAKAGLHVEGKSK